MSESEVEAVSFDLTGKVAMVTGAGRGIGQGVATAFARAGADVGVTELDVGDLSATVEAIERTGRRAAPVRLELRDLGSISPAVDEIEQRLGPIDILVNNAGVQRLRLALDVRPEDWDFVLDVNLRGLFFCSQEVGRRMVGRGRGKIINLSSAAGLIPWRERAAYAASKAGVLMLTRIMALEWAELGVTVNAIAPTFVETELGKQTLAQPGVREQILRSIPLGRLGQVSDVAAAAIYLASAAGDFVTGATLSVDGGLVMR
jgi:NAD(P)-dependent dehydrogenase (short-subunit alcohol dehydrogenase family)